MRVAGGKKPLNTCNECIYNSCMSVLIFKFAE